MALSDQDKKTRRWLLSLFWGQVAAFVTLLSSILVPFLRDLIRPAFLPLMGGNSILHAICSKPSGKEAASQF